MSSSENTSKSSTGTDDVLPSDVHAIVANERRQLALQCLTDVEGQITIGALVERIATREEASLESDGGWDRLASELHHVHLPKLDAAGLVTYDPSTHIIDVGLD